MKTTLPTVGLLDRLPNGKPAREYVDSAHTDIRVRFYRIQREMLDEYERRMVMRVPAEPVRL